MGRAARHGLAGGKAGDVSGENERSAQEDAGRKPTAPAPDTQDEVAAVSPRKMRGG